MDKLNNHIKVNIDNKENETKKCIQKFKHLLNLDQIPQDLNISTMTVICKFYTNFYTENIGAYVNLHPDKIISVSYGDSNDPITNRSIAKSNKKRKPNKKSGNTFYNQTTICVMSKYDNKDINVKIFKNGSIQMTGCKSIIGCINVLSIVCEELKKVKAIIDPQTLSKIILKPFVSNTNAITLDQVTDLKICMINSGFDIGFQINREELYKILCEDGVECKLKDNHACVNIKYNYKDRKKISIFVFASGSVIITGANNCNHILEAYEYITVKLIKNYQKIKNIQTSMNRSDICNFLDKN